MSKIWNETDTEYNDCVSVVLIKQSLSMHQKIVHIKTYRAHITVHVGVLETV